jgi:metacaspase-1
MKKAVCIGINNYPGTANDLQGCINDANDWAALLLGFGFSVNTMLDAQATRQNVKAALGELVSAAGAGDVVVFTYSGHGTQVFDISGDEGDTYDEAIYVYDGTVLDDELRAIITNINPQATLVVISDSCFSGTVTRIAPEAGKPRYMPPSGVSARSVVKQRFLLPEASMPEILISGCTDSEYSYDAEFNGRPNGAMSALAIRVIKENPQVTYSEFYANLRKLLPSSTYPQSPQLEGSPANKDRLLFEPFSVEPEPTPEPGPTPEPTPDPTPEPTPEPPGCVLGAIQGIARFFKGG